MFHSYEVRFWRDNKPVPREILLKEIANVQAMFTLMSEEVDEEFLDAGI